MPQVSGKRPRPNGRLFFSVMVTYLVLLAVVVGLFVIGYTTTVRATREDAVSSQLVLLEQIREDLDLRLGRIRDISSLLATNPHTLAAAEFTQEDVESQYVYRDLNEFLSIQNAILDEAGNTVIYFNKAESVITGQSRYRTGAMEAYTRTIGMEREDFRALAALAKGTQGCYRVIRPNTRQEQLLFLMPIYGSRYQWAGTVMTAFSTASLSEALTAVTWLEGSVCCMINGDNSMYIGDGPGIDTAFSLGDSAYRGVPLTGEPTTVKLNGRSYETVAVGSADSAWRYYFSVPSEVFTRSGRVYIIIFLVTLLAITVFGLALSFIFSHQLTAPIDKILRALRLENARAFPEAVRTLSEALETCRADLSTAQRRAWQGDIQRRRVLLYNLCRGSISPGQIASELKKLDIPLREGPVSLVMFVYEDPERSVFFQDGYLNSDLMMFASSNVVEELLCPQGGGVFYHGGRVICLYQPGEGASPKVPRDILEKIHDFHASALELSVCAPAAGTVERLSELHTLMTQAEEMAQYKSFWGSGVPDVLYYDEMASYADLLTEEAPDLPHKQFLNLLAVRDYEAAHALLMEQLDTGMAVLETSSRVGCQESRALIRAFKRYENMTPGQYQALQAGKA